MADIKQLKTNSLQLLSIIFSCIGKCLKVWIL